MPYNAILGLETQLAHWLCFGRCIYGAVNFPEGCCLDPPRWPPKEFPESKAIGTHQRQLGPSDFVVPGRISLYYTCGFRDSRHLQTFSDPGHNPQRRFTLSCSRNPLVPSLPPFATQLPCVHAVLRCPWHSWGRRPIMLFRTLTSLPALCGAVSLTPASKA